ncbi:glycosyltransferase [Candidatus Parabeggiatoa sp. HSG14]|uniref:glycosyltransferase n=1 Tax=Candidatus Parabeggiatoa sp. HSG14 TaxID=3055593 RepID=UPI0025A7C9E5|nr:glycosyltransferase [Thiotrichales bacterium HSG14]
MKILMVTRENHPDVNYGSDKRYGLNKSLAPVVNELIQRGIEVGYLSQTDAGEKGITFLRSLHGWLVKIFGRFFTKTELSPLLWGILERLNMGRLAVKVMAREQYTHVHCHDFIIAAGYRAYARVQWFACLRQCHTARWGLTEHGFGCYTQAFHEDGVRLSTKVMRWLRRWETKILLKAHWVTTPTRNGLAQLGRDLSIYPIPSTWHAVYHPRPILNTYTKSEARQQLEWAAQDIYIIAVGRFAELKQFPALIRAAAHLQHPHWKLVLIGEGDRIPLQNLAIDLGIAERLAFSVTDDIGLYYSAADIYVSTSLTESFGMANLEALVMGLPSVCTAVGGVPEVLGSGARLIPAQDNSALVQALQTLLDDANIRYYWAQQARQWADNWPDSSTIADALLAIYQDNPLPDSTQQFAFPNIPLFEWHQQVNQWQKCPLPGVLDLPKQAKILVIAPHSDDETLGCGGTLALLQQNGCHVKVVVVTDSGSKGEPLGESDIDVVKTRQQESIAALNLLGVDDILFLTEPDGYFQYTPLIAEQLTTILANFVADWIFLPTALDYHRDHISVSLTLLPLWQQRGCKERVFLYETWAPVPTTWIVDISTTFTLKQQAIQCYKLPLQYCDYKAIITGLMQYRGLYLKQSGEYAEAFLELEANSWQSVLSHLLSLRNYQEKFLQ